ncbi:MAG: ribonuclease P protein component [Myxococcota bacterium]|nr:ribonuclease P protein component [Myxococcota bacterium]
MSDSARVLAPRQGERFGPAEKLRRSADFSRVQRGGQRLAGTFIVVVGRRGAAPWTRIGLTVSRKIGPAVLRNRVKRRLRDVFRRNKMAFFAYLDVVVIARSGAANVDYASLRDEVLLLIGKLGKRLHLNTMPEKT